MSSDSPSAIPDIEANGDIELPAAGEEAETTRMMRRDIVMRFASPSANLEIEPNGDGQLPPGGEEDTRERSILHMMGIEDERKFGTYLLGVAVPMAVTLVVSSSSLVQTTELRIVAVSLSAAVLLTFNGLSLHGNFPETSSWMLLSGAGLITLCFYALIALFLPPNLKWIPVVFCLASLIIPFAMSDWNYFRGD